jgi:glycosyltransferase involved in cell wall biosynthesis
VCAHVQSWAMRGMALQSFISAAFEVTCVRGPKARERAATGRGRVQYAGSMESAERGSLRILHAIHDFLPRHAAGSEIYAAELALAQARRHHVTITCAEYAPLQRHGDVNWRLHQGLPVVEITNNWLAPTFRDTYSQPLMTERLRHVLRAVQPDVLHIHNLLNLSFELPSVARALGIPTVATLHDYTLVCASGGQRVHQAEGHTCTTIDPQRCARCFAESPFHSMRSLGPLAQVAAQPSAIGRTLKRIASRFPAVARSARTLASAVAPAGVTSADIASRLMAARQVFHDVDLFIAPSPALGEEYLRLGIPAHKLRVSDYGFVPLAVQRRPSTEQGRLRIGFVGTLVWHKGVHVLIDAVRRLPAERYSLVIHGSTSTFPDYVETLRSRAGTAPITFAGGFTRDQAKDIYGGFDVLVVPSIWPENSPLVIHEAFMAGVPVVGARNGGIVDLIDDNRNGILYDATDVGALAGALERLIDDPSMLDRMARHIPAVKSIGQDAGEVEAIYRDLLACRAS